MSKVKHGLAFSKIMKLFINPSYKSKIKIADLVMREVTNEVESNIISHCKQQLVKSEMKNVMALLTAAQIYMQMCQFDDFSSQTETC